MNDIDFLPASYREKSAQRKTQAWRVVVVIAFSALLAAGALGQFEIRRQLERHLVVVSEQHARVMAEGKKLADLQARLREVTAEAELLTYLRHPWPPTQILAHICEPMTDAITLTKLQIHRQESVAPQLQPVLAPGQTPEQRAQAEAAQPIAARALEKLRALTDDAPLTVTIEGDSDDSASVHVYLGKLAESDWFSEADLGSVERIEGNPRGAFHFVARLTVREAHFTRNAIASTAAPIAPQQPGAGAQVLP